MKRSLFSLALACLAVAAAVPASAQISTSGLPETSHGPFNLAEAYPCTAMPYPTGTVENTSIAAPQLFTGTCAARAGFPGAAPGVLCLRRPTDTNGVPTSTFLDINCFAVAPAGETNCAVQAFRFFKMVPGSFKCPDVYGMPHFDSDGKIIFYQYIQFGNGVRTWWPLNFTQPGTRFLLQVVSACQIPRPTTLNPNASTTEIHIDSWRWRVVANEATLLSLINLMHEGAISTLEVPCILGEDMYDALIKAQGKLATAIAEPASVTVGTSTVPNGNRLNDIGNALFDMEALIVANCLFVEVLNPLVAFPGPDQFSMPNIQPPGNLAQTVTFGNQGSAVAGIVDTIEHPCCCKLLVDLEYIAIFNGIVGQLTAKGTTLPVIPAGG